jgi:hypothetical protein
MTTSAGLLNTVNTEMEGTDENEEPVYNHDEEEDFSFNWFFLVIDPIFRFWFCGLSPF